MNRLFSDNLSLIFPSLTLLKGEDWSIPYHKSSVRGERRVDALAFYHKKNKYKLERLALIEYKWHDKTQNPIDQVKKYNSFLTNDQGNCLIVQREYNNYLDKEGKRKIDLELTKKGNFWKNFCGNNILICVAPFNYYEIHDTEETRDKNIILVEVQRYGNNENDFLLVSLQNSPILKKRRNEWKELLEMKTESIIVPIPKSEKPTTDKTLELPKKSEENGRK